MNKVNDLIKGNPYPGRGIIIGKTPNGEYAVTAYFIMGRSENSRNRIFVERDGEVFTEPYDESKVDDPSLIIYAAIRQYKNNLIVTNGNQTDTIYDFLERDKCFRCALKTRKFEPDAPNFTPRISGLLTFDDGDFNYQMSILKCLDNDGNNCGRYIFDYPSQLGIGHFIHTYITDGDPIPSFKGEPEIIETNDDIDAFTNELWDALDSKNKISLYVRYINLKTNETENRCINERTRA
ncbi:MAG: IMP cyclohydrolase [Coriobacteriia bacterium]|nr:IMP cyclohydrolase [Coriobacteriia bacterium]